MRAMKAIVLAGGRGSRMGILTDTIPKPLIKVGGRELLIRTLDVLHGSIDECVIVVGYHGKMIRDFLGCEYNGRRIRYVEQRQSGTGGALLSAKSFVTEGEYVLVINSDDVFGKDELDTLLCGAATYGIMFGMPPNRSDQGIIFRETGVLHARIQVKKQDPRFFGVGVYVLPWTVYDKPFHQFQNGEYSIPHSLYDRDFPVYVKHISYWLPVNTPEDLQRVEFVLQSHPNF